MKISLVLPIYNEQLELAEVLAKYVTDLKECKKLFEGKAEENVDAASGKKGSKKADIKTDAKEAVKVDAKKTLSYEIIAVNDGSDDGTLDILTSAARLNRNLRIINLEGRWGKQSAINAGMEAAKGDVVILADIDVLNPIGVLQRMIKEHLKGSEIVYAKRERHGLDAVKNAWSDGFVRVATGLFGIEGHYTGRTHLMLFGRNVVDVINALPHKNKLLRTMDTWLGWEINYITFASGYNKSEEKAKHNAAVAQFKGKGKEPPARSNIREHSASRVYGSALGWLSIVALAVSVVLMFAVEIDFFYHFVLWSVALIFGFLSMLFYCRAALIKRVGIIYNKKFTDEIYQIKNIIN